jgi:hypothetical protein
MLLISTMKLGTIFDQPAMSASVEGKLIWCSTGRGRIDRG